MARGQHPKHLFSNTRVNKAQEQLWNDLNDFTDEVFEENVERFNEFSVFLLMPPCFDNDGRFVKGLLATHATDFILSRWPWLKSLFHVTAYAMWSGYPRATQADAFMVPYDNPARKAWYDRKYPEYAHLPVFPVDDTDLFNEAEMVSMPEVAKDIDVLQVARLDQIKNLEMFARAAKIAGHVAGRPLKIHLHTGSVVDVNWSQQTEAQRVELMKMQAVLGVTQRYLTISPGQVPSLAELYNRSRVVTMTALCEGRNRAIHEAMSCGTPVVTFEAYNQFSRGDDVVFPAGGGYRAPQFTAQSLAETWVRTIKAAEEGWFNPREAVLAASGRRAVTNTVLRGFADYYRAALPGWSPEQPVEQNAWLQENMQAVYKTDLENWWFSRQAFLGKPRFHVKGLQDIAGVAEIYAKLVLPGGERGVGE